MQEKLFIFDCDGVLVDSEYLSSKIFAEALAAFGYQISIEESIRRFTGVSAEAARQIVMAESSIDIPENYWVLQQPKLLEAFSMQMNALQKPILETFEKQHISRCVASNSSRKHILECLESSQQLSYFNQSAIFSAQQVSQGKPSPELFMLASSCMGFEPAKCVVIEDSHPGIEAAIAAGMSVIIFLGGSHAGYDWYRCDIEKYGLPMAHSSQELLQVIQQL